MLAVTKTKEQLIKVIQYCLKNSVKYTILGKGSNVLISDKGVKDLVIINEYSGIETLSKMSQSNNIKTINPTPRVNVKDYSDLDYLEEDLEKIAVNIASGTILSYSINHLISKGITGLQWFAGIPGTIGGALFNNIHGGTHFFSEFILSALVIDEKGELIELTKDQMKFDYDESIFHSKKFIIIEVKLLLNLGDAKKALKASQAWVKKKAETQPFNSGGCCFKNLSNDEKESKSLISNSWGYIIDNLLHLKGTQIGDAIISNKHGAFIENIGEAKATDVLELMRIIYNKAKESLKITPKTEIIFIGFDKKEIEVFI
jgi:UDP-N-acetylmuramate dehydrogenase